VTMSNREIDYLKTTLTNARGGRASLLELARAHHLADRANLPGCAAELRAHIRAVAADHHVDAASARRDVFTGVVSGVLTHVLLGGLLG